MSFNIAISGLNAAQSDLSTTANNIANAGTTGFKNGRSQFADLYTRGSAINAGAGVRVAGVKQDFNQGSIEFTGNELDLAISGNGFFVLRDNNGAQAYTRAGAFSVNSAGAVVNNAGQKLQVYLNGNNGRGGIGDLVVSRAELPPRATSSVDLGLNLPANAAVTSAGPYSVTGQAANGAAVTTAGNTIFTLNGQTITVNTTATAATNLDNMVAAINAQTANTGVTAAIQGTAPTQNMQLSGDRINLQFVSSAATTGPAPGVALTAAQAATALGLPTGFSALQGFDPANSATYNHSFSTTVFDSLGTPQTATVFLNKVANNTWNARVAYNNGTPSAPQQVVFDASGKLTTPASGKFSLPLTLTNGATTSQPIEFDLSGIKQLGTAFSVNSVEQNGYTTGRLSGVAVGADGTVSGTYSNGRIESLGQIAVANFNGVDSLQQVGNATWVETVASGPALLGAAGSGSLGRIESNSLESSNVDMTKELVHMITAQRNFQANAKLISASDQLAQTIINLR